MTKLVLRALVVIVVIAAAVFVWRFFFPGPKTMIRRRLDGLAEVASFNSREAPLAKAANSQKLTTFFTSDVEFQVDLPGRPRQTMSGHDELLQTALAARSFLGGLSVEFLDINISLGLDKQSALVDLTVKAKALGDADLIVQELRFTMKKVQGDWLIRRVETVKTLMWLERPGGRAI